MLVLTRNANETIHVDGPAIFHILDQRGSKVRVGVEAPKTTTIKRGELVDDGAETGTQLGTGTDDN